MVGVPRSTGCALCVKRRVKCDQARPACAKCTKYGAQCPGYEREMKFVQEKHNIRSRRGGSSDSTSNSPKSSSRVSSGTSSRRVSDDGIKTTRKQHKRTEDIQYVLREVQTVYGASELSELDFVFHTITQLLGKKLVLDNALWALGLYLLGKAYTDEDRLANSRAVYGEALRDLQKAVNDSSESRETETLCACAVLMIFELFAATGSSSWTAHATGIAVLMVGRGAHHFTGQINGVVLLHVKKLLLFCDMCPPYGVKESFLAKPEWQDACNETCRDMTAGMSQPYSDRFVANNEFNSILAELPYVVHNGTKIRNQFRLGQQPTPGSVERLATRSSHLYQRVCEWQAMYSHLAPNPTTVAADPQSIVPIAYSFSEPWVASFHLDCWAMLIILNESLRLCGVNAEEHRNNNISLVRNIVWSIENVSRGLLGPLRMAFALRVAVEFVDVPTQRWIHAWLHEFSSRMGAMAAHGFPCASVNEYNVTMA